MDKQPLPDHAVPKEAEEYLKSLTPEKMELHKMAQEKLGSSYFIERSKGFIAWKDKQKK